MATDPPDTTTFEPSHTLMAVDFHGSAGAIFELALDRATDGYVGIDHDELEMGLPDAPRCRTTWNAVRDSLSWVDDEHPGAWYHVPLPDASAELRDLWSLEDGNSGAFFLHTVVLTIDDEWLFFAVPHHSLCWLNAPNESFVDAVDDALATHRACILPEKTRVEWSGDGRNYSISGTSLCVEGGRLRTRGCYGLSNLEAVRANEDERTLSLTWQPDPIPGAVGRALMSAMSLVYNPPERLQFEDEVTFRDVESVLRKIIEKRDPTV